MLLRTRSSKLSVLRRIKKGSNNSTTNDPCSFSGRGITLKGKLIGEQNVCEARGAEMCAEAMQKAKSAVKAANMSKARILLQITQDGIKILDEKSHSYKFYAIKTAQAADQAVIAIREMFQMVFEKKAKQMKPAIQHQEDIQKATNPFVATSTMAVDPCKACSTVDWAFKENADTHTAASTSQPKMDLRWNEPSKRVTSLDECFSKMVDMDVIIGPSKVKENPFHHIINPPKCSLNSMGSGSCAAAVNANSDPFGLDFFS